jgi:hypothetical protein
MGLFKKKKKENLSFAGTIPKGENKGIPALKLPELPKLSEEKLGFPKYGEEFSAIKKEVEKSPIPVRKKSIKPMSIPQLSENREIAQPMSIPKRSIPVSQGGKPIFVKIDSYKEAIEAIETIKGLCKEADSVLADLSKIRSEEDKELAKWHSDIEKVKNKLLVVDKKLFEL